MNPCGGEYVFGIPRFSKMTIAVPGQKTLEIEAKNIETGKKVKSVTLNGKKEEGFTIQHKDLVAGGKLVYELE
ncbi:glycoside hydrolase family 92 protein [bacterium]|nr:glycoside hydrolase family 92 protein [bacterium]